MGYLSHYFADASRTARCTLLRLLVLSRLTWPSQTARATQLSPLLVAALARVADCQTIFSATSAGLGDHQLQAILSQGA
ncbi:hypothetical protein B0H12DRAFT_1145660 [Mycena haematopus]|nr:hypothetical protein B0H12DRAFT_1145660 [Mycena haematopus]